MPPESLKRIIIILTLGLLTVSAFFIRLENFINSRPRSVDEIVYFRMGAQVAENVFDYNTIAYGHELASKGRPLPEYFFLPLYKHPPLFTFAIALSMKAFTPTLLAAGIVSLLMGALMVPLVYGLAATLFDRKTALLAALLMWLDPVTVISSQKVWLDVMIAFFMTLAVLLFFLAAEKKRDACFFASGIAVGLAVLTKYTGILAWAVILPYAFIHERELFRRKSFLWSLAVPFIMLIPWMIWNWEVYGGNFLSVQLNIHDDMSLLALVQKLALPGFFFLIAAWMLLRLLGRLRAPDRSAPASGEALETPSRLRRFLLVAVGLCLLVVIRENIAAALQFLSMPRTSWRLFEFVDEPAWFYFGRLVEFSLFYLFAFASYFMPQKDKRVHLLQVGSLLILVFFMAWGNYQSRYILGAIPLLIVLASRTVFIAFERLDHIGRPALRLALLGVLSAFCAYALLKTIAVDILVSFPNDLCYF
jgi:4-amino-4-deoxy-L-arabinose transferase-like glycosyltransferase